MGAVVHKGTNKRILVNTIALYLRLFFVLFLSLFSTRFVLEGLGEVNFGIYNLIAGVVGLFGFISATMAASTQRFISFEIGASQDVEKVKYVFNTSVKLHFYASFIIAAIVIVGGMILIQYSLNIPSESWFAARIVLLCVGFGVFATIIGVPYEAILMAHENIVFVAILKIGTSILNLATAIFILLFCKGQIIVYAILMCLIPVVATIVEYLYTKSHYKETAYKDIPLKENTTFKEMRSFIGLSIWGNLGWAIRGQGVSIILNVLWGVMLNAANGIANQVNGALLSLSSAMTTSIRPQLIQSAGEGNYHRMLNLAISACKYPIAILSIVGIPIFVAMPYVLELWLKVVPDYSVIFCQCLLVELIISQSSFGMVLVLDALGKIRRLHLIVGWSLIVTTVIAYFIGSLLDTPIALYLCIIVNTAFIATVRIVLACKEIRQIDTAVNVNIFFKSVLKQWIVIGVIFIIIKVIWNYMPSNILGFCALFVSSAILCCFCFYKFIFSEAERAKIQSVKRRIINKVKHGIVDS